MWHFFVLALAVGSYQIITVDDSIQEIMDRVRLEAEQRLVDQGYDGNSKHTLWTAQEAAEQIVNGRNLIIKMKNEFDEESELCIKLYDDFKAIELVDVCFCEQFGNVFQKNEDWISV